MLRTSQFLLIIAVIFMPCSITACAREKAGTPIELSNAGFEATTPTEAQIPGWRLKQHAGAPSYEMTIDRAEHRRGNASFRILRLKPQFYGSISQQVALPHGAAMHRIRLRAAVRTQQVGTEGFKLLLSFHAADHMIDAVEGESVSGDTRWHDVEVEATLPAEARSVEVGATLYGDGTAWLDDVRLEITR